jgi:hypothetical protein
MLEDLPKARSTDLERVFKSLMNEEQQRAIDDRRASVRLPFVRPLAIKMRSESKQVIEAFSRNISTLGIGVVSKEAFKMGDLALIEIHRFNREPSVVLSECRWADSFGSKWYFSGWVFLSLIRE